MERWRVAASFADLDSAFRGMVNSVAFGASAMKITGLGTDRLRLKLRIMSDDDLWWLFLNHRHECSQEFWERIGNSKSRWYIIQRKPLVHYPTTVHSGRWASSQNTVTREVPATIPT